MKIFAFTDLHENLNEYKKIKEKVKKEKPDLILCAGDFTVFEQHIKEMLDKIKELGKILLVHGNHETEVLTKKLCKKKGILFLHKKVEIIKNYAFVGFGGLGFEVISKDFENFIKRIKPKLRNKKIILLTHAPPYNTKLDYLWGQHVGNKSFTKFIKNNKVVLTVCGHFHETFKKRDKIGEALIINPGPAGEIIKLK